MGFAVLTVLVLVFRVGAGPLGGANRWNVASLPFVTVHLGPAILGAAALVAGIGAWLLSRTSARRPEVSWAVLLGLFLPVVAYSVWNPVVKAEKESYPSGWQSPEPVASALAIGSVAYDEDHFVGGLYSIQWFLPRTSVVLFHGNGQKPPSRYLLSNQAWGGGHPEANAVSLWTSRGRDLVLWRLNG
jgi:hypothetical protein